MSLTQVIDQAETEVGGIPNTIMKAFVSYSHQDANFLDSDVLPALESVGVTPWTDRDIVVGDSWIQSVVDQITNGDWLVVLFTEAYQNAVEQRAGPCYRELEWIIEAMTTSRAPGRLIIVWRAGELPDLLKNYQAINVQQDTGQLLSKLEIAAQKDRLLLDPSSPPPSTTSVSTVEPPTVRGPEDLPDLARYNFDTNAARYARGLFAGQSMQSGNAESLLKYLARYFNRQGPKPDSWLDIGCGPGLVAFVAEERIRIHQCAWLNRCRKRMGFDYAPNLLEQMPPWTKQNYTDLFVGDVLKVDPKRLLQKTGVSQVDLLLANNVFHWLFTEEAIDAAFKRCRDILKGGGCLAASIAAIGSAKDFLQAYEGEVREALNPKDYERWRSHLQNPIGLQSLDGIVRIARRNGFIIEPADAQLVYEPVRYNNGTDEYVEDARSYGDHVFMAPLFNQSRHQKDEVWQGIKRRLRQNYQAQFNGSVYVHDQYMIYLLARRDD